LEKVDIFYLCIIFQLKIKSQIYCTDTTVQWLMEEWSKEKGATALAGSRLSASAATNRAPVRALWG